MYQTGLRNKPTYNPTQYSVEWANIMTGYIRKQLHEISLPAAPRSGNIKVTFKGVLADQESRQKWLSCFTYWYSAFCALFILAHMLIPVQFGPVAIILR